jgi:hypothetical protein
MNENCHQPSDNRSETAAVFMRRPTPATSAAKAAELSDLPQSPDSREAKFHEPERWDGLS